MRQTGCRRAENRIWDRILQKGKDTPVKKMLYYILILFFLVCTAVVVFWSFSMDRKMEEKLLTEATPAVQTEKPARSFDLSSLLVEAETVRAEMVAEGLRDVGKLITEEYYFTQVISRSSVKKLWNFSVPFSKSDFLISYDGVVSAGIDLSAASVEMDRAERKVIIRIPGAKIMTVDIDENSFVKYSENEGLGNPITMDNYNDALKEIEENASEKAREKGILDKAQENAERMIREIADGLLGDKRYTVEIIKEDA